MSTSTVPAVFSELYGDLISRVRSQTGVTAIDTLAKRYIDLANQDIYIGTSEKFPWAKRQTTITTHPQYTTGTVSITVGSTSVTGTSTVWTTNNSYGQPNARAGGKITFEGSDEVYRVTAVGGAGSMTISPAYIGTTDTSATYVYFEDEYALASDFIRPYDFTSFDDHRQIHLIGDMDFRRMFPRNRFPTQRVKAATIIDFAPSGNTTPIRKVRFAPPPSGVQLIPYSYITSNTVTSTTGAEQTSFSADTDEPIIPKRYRHLLVFHALYHWYRDQKDDTRSQQAKGEYEQLLSRVVSDQEIGQQRTSIDPRSGVYYGYARRPWGGRGQRYDIDSRFDRLEDLD